MKTILVDAVLCFVDERGSINKNLHDLLETFPNKKIILTGADDEQMRVFGLDRVPYEVFTLAHDPEKTDPRYYRLMLEHFGLKAEDVVYFEHAEEAIESARSVDIETFHYNDRDKENIQRLHQFLTENA